MNKNLIIAGSIAILLILAVSVIGLVVLDDDDSGSNGENQGTEQQLSNENERPDDRRADDQEPASSAKEGNTIVLLNTNYGEIKIELFSEKMPITAGNFEDLVKEGFYDGIIFHRVIPEFMVQGGDPQGNGTGGPGYTIEDEFVEDPELSNVRGTLSMANSGPNSGGSQFFINLVDNTYLDWDKEPATSKHPVFGKVIAGMDVVDEIAQVETGSADKPLQDVVIESAEIL